MNKFTLLYETSEEYKTAPKMLNSQDTYERLKPCFEDVMQYKERGVMLCLNNANKIVGWNVISEGAINGTIMDIKIIMQNALMTNASAIIIAHNHPSGNLKPSHADIKLTDKIKRAGEVMDIKLLDHIIITEEGFFSFADEGMI